MNEVLEVVIKSRPDQFVAGMQTASTSGEKFVAVMNQIGRTATAVGDIVNRAIGQIQKGGRIILAGGTAMSAGLAGATYAASQFEVGLRNIMTVADPTVTSIRGLSDSLLSMSTKFPQSAQTLTDGLYDITSSGFDGAEALTVLEASAKAASAGLTSTGVSAATIAAIINAYGHSASDATDISDTLFQAVNYGVMSFEELAASTGDWVSMAAAAGVRADEAAAALAVMTLTGMSAAEASTSLSRIMTEFISPGEKMSEVLAELGFESGTAMLETLGLREAMFTLAQVTGGTAESFSKLFPDIRGTRGALALMAQEGATYVEVGDLIMDVNARAGATQAAFAEQSKATAAQFQILQNNLMALTITFGQIFLPMLNLALRPLTQLLQFLNDMPTPVKWLISGLAALTSGIMLLTGVVVGFMAKQLIWTMMNRLLARQLEGLAGRAGVGLLANGLNRLSALFRTLGSAGGPIGGTVNVLKSFVGALGLANRLTPTTIRLIGGATAGAAVLGVGLIALSTQWGRAERAGRQAGEEFAKALTATSTEEAQANIKALEDRLTSLASSNSWIQMTEFGPRVSNDEFFQGNFLEDVAAQFQGTIDFIMGGRRAAEAEMEALVDAYNTNLQRIRVAQDTLGDIVREDIFKRHGGMPGWERSGLGEWLMSGERQIKRLERLAKNAGLNIINEFDPYAAVGTEEHQRFLDRQAEIEQSLRDLMDANDGASAHAVTLEQDILGLADAFDNAKTKIEALENVLRNALDIDFGYEEAVDNFNRGLNETYKQIQDIKEAGTLGDALDPTSMHEDAIALRESLRGMVEDAANVAIEWAKAQPNLTGAQFTTFLQNQASEMEVAMRSMGLGEEQIARYTAKYLELANSPDLELAINNNFDEAADGFDNLMAKLGLAPEEITTAVNLYTQDGEDALAEYLESLGRTPAEIRTAAELITGDAIAKLEEWNEELKLADQDIDTLLKLTVEGDQAAIDAFLEKKGITRTEYEAFVKITGTNESGLILNIINERLDKLTGEYNAHVGISGPYESQLADINRALDELERRRIRIDIELGRAPGPPFIMPNGRTNANGNLYENHQAEIAPGGAWRIWAEPETGGEAYIPLSPAKRGRSMEIFQQVAEIFGVKAMFFANGGIDFSSRVRSGSSRGGGSGGSRSSAQIARETERAAEEAWRRVANQFRTGHMGRDEYLAQLQARLAGLEAFSDEWTSTWEEIKRVEQDREREIIDFWDGVWAAVQNAFEVGDGFITEDHYRQILQDRLNGFAKYSEEWMEAWRELQRLDEERQRREEERIRKEEEARDLEDRKVALRRRQKQISDSEFLAYLRTRLTQETQYSDRWFDIMNQIIDMEERITQDTKRIQEEREDTLFARGAMGLDAYIGVLRSRLAAVEQYSSEWASIMQEIDDLTGATAVRQQASLSPFMGMEYVSENTLIRYYERKAAKAHEWMTIVRELAASGQVSNFLLQDLIQGGPDSLPLARTLQRMVSSGSISRLNDSFDWLANSNGPLGDFQAAPVQPTAPSMNQAAREFAAQFASMVNIEQMVIRNEADLQAMVQQLSYDIRSHFGS